jgi:hypothetical protein
VLIQPDVIAVSVAFSAMVGIVCIDALRFE